MKIPDQILLSVVMAVMVSVFSANEETISRVNKYGLLEEQHCDPEEIDRNSHGTGMPGIRVS